MDTKPSRNDLQRALAAAGTAHHDYEQEALKGSRDEHWAGWYAAYVLGRLGDFTSPSTLTRWLENAPTEGEWAASAADHLMRQLGN
ncbi:MAG: hypothetical protein ACE5NW_06735 [Acidiferrobacterales bacterium]